MAQETHISWTKSTWNPWIGCSKVSAGCQYCYAEALMDKRYGRVQWGPSGTRSKTSLSNWRDPVRWNRKAARSGEEWRVFCASLADIFEDWRDQVADHKGQPLFRCTLCDSEELCRVCMICTGNNVVPLTLDHLRKDLFRLVENTPHLTWLLLTKRPENVRSMIPSWWWDKPQHNVWYGTSTEDQENLEKRLPELARIPATRRFLSVEPMLGPLEFASARGIESVSWAIFGGESAQGGAAARRCEPGWIEDGIAQCRKLDIAPFVKQLGSNCGLVLEESHGANPAEWPEALRVQEVRVVHAYTGFE